MRNTITLNGIASTTIAGLLIQELPAISKPLMRTTIEEIDGRDGDIVTELGYSAYDKEITIGLYGSFDINAVIAYFATEGTVVFSNEPDKFYRYKIIDKIDYERLVRYRTATVKLHCQPFKYPTTETPVQLGSGQTITAEGTDLTMQGTALAPFVSITPKGDTFQQTYTGKNLLLATSTGSPANGILATNNSDGTVTLSGTGTESAVAPFSDTTLDLPAGTYTLSLTESLPVRTLLSDVVASHNTWVIEPGGTSVTATTTATTKIRLWFYLANGVAIDKTVGFQLESGETASAFEPYVGGTAAPNPQYPQAVKTVTREQMVKVEGWQLCPGLDNQSLVTYNSSQTTYEPLTNGWCKVGYASDATYHNIGISNAQNYIKPSTEYTYIVELNKVINPGNASYTVLQSHNESAFGDATYIGKIGDAVVSGRTSIRTSSNGYGAAAWKATSKDASVLSNKPLIRSWIGSHLASGDSWNIRISIIEGDHTSDWQNYCDNGWRPYSHQTYELNFGKNLLNPDDLVTGYVMSDGTINTSAGTGDKATQSFIPVQPSSKVTFTIFETTSTYDPWFGLCEYSQANEASFISPRQVNQTAGITSATFTIGPNTHYIRVSARNMAAATKYQLEYGDKTTYAPYKTPMELCKIGDYQDYIYKNGNDWYKHEAIKKETLPTSGYSRWTTQPTACMFYKNGVLSDALFQKGLVTAVVENLPVMPQVGNMTEYYNTYAQTNQYGFVLKVDTPGFMVQNKDYSTVADFHTWIAANPIEVRYVLATPVDTKITNEALIEQLNALGNANSYRDTTYIKTASNGTDLPVILAVTATGKADGTVTNAGNTYAKPKLTIYGTGNIGIYLNGNQMLQIELGSEGHITIDTEKMEAYKDSESNLKNRLVTGDYSKFRLEAGENRIDFSGNINKCVVENYTRWL